MAALRAAIMATAIHATRTRRLARSHAPGRLWTASSAPVSANGSANTEWLKRTNEVYVASRLKAFKGVTGAGLSPAPAS